MTITHRISQGDSVLIEGNECHLSAVEDLGFQGNSVYCMNYNASIFTLLLLWHLVADLISGIMHLLPTGYNLTHKESTLYPSFKKYIKGVTF